jgi:hypothetical protein
MIAGPVVMSRTGAMITLSCVTGISRPHQGQPGAG